MRFTSVKAIKKDSVIFNEATTNQYGHQRINIEAKHGWGENTPGPLVLESPLRFSFGVQKSLNKAGDITGYSIPICLWDEFEDEPPSRKEFDFYAGLKELKNLCYDHLEEVFGVETAQMLKFPLVEKEGKPPILYTKLMYSEKTQRIHTLFHSKEKSKENPLDFLDQYMKVKMAVIVDSIYISDDSVSVQLRLHDVYVKPLPQRQPMVTLSPEEEYDGEEYGEEDEDDEYEKEKRKEYEEEGGTCVDYSIGEEKIKELKALYTHYHKKWWCSRKIFKSFKRKSLLCNLGSSFLIVAGGIAGGVTLNPIILGVISGSGLLLKTFTDVKRFDRKLDMSRFSYTTYEKILTELRSYLRGRSFDKVSFLNEVRLIDDTITDLCPMFHSSRLVKQYEKRFTNPVGA
ncbi:hypothetical protein AWC38_SpisGene14425 [Stylophora pistillata]|uniref:Uncharacterized protein n=1 Tax=Stylophora pistillata TaxID=50429 RepID=A0A2B4RV95_STYPI|nr:hypothetical protein AWC38_SpisGene14425 [Stylophora pistillata]